MKNKRRGLGNKNLLSFPKHDSLEYWRLKSNVNSHMSIQYVNQSESLSWSFSDLSGGKWCLQRKYMCRQHETLDYRKLHKQLSNSCHRSGKGHVWQLNGILLYLNGIQFLIFNRKCTFWAKMCTVIFALLYIQHELTK